MTIRQMSTHRVVVRVDGGHALEQLHVGRRQQAQPRALEVLRPHQHGNMAICLPMLGGPFPVTVSWSARSKWFIQSAHDVKVYE